MEAKRLGRHWATGSADGIRDPNWSKHMVGSRSEQFQNAVLNQIQANRPATSLSPRGPRIVDGHNLLNVAAPRRALDIR